MNDAAIAAAMTADRAEEDAPLDLAGATAAIERLLDGEDEPAAEAGDEAPSPAVGSDDALRPRVRRGGAEQEMTLADIVALYRSGTGAAAAELPPSAPPMGEFHDALTAAHSQHAGQARALDSLVPQLRAQVQAFAGTDWARVAAEDPALYAQARPAYEAAVAQLGAAEAAQARLADQQQRLRQAAATAQLQRLTAERDAFIKKVPELADRDAARREMAALGSYLAQAGYQPQELDRLVDHRDLILARKAMLYDRLMESRGRLAATVQALPRMQGPGTPAERGDRGAARRAMLMRTLQRTGRTEDAARLIEDLI